MIFTTGIQPLSASTASDFQALRTKFQDGSWTGILEAVSSSGKSAVFFFCGGVLKCAYQVISTTAQKTEAETTWDSLTNPHPANVALMGLSAAALRLVKIMMEHPAPAETLVVKSSRLERIIDQWMKQPHPNLAFIKRAEKQGLAVLWPGLPVPPFALTVSADGVHEDANAFRQTFSLDMGDCDAARHAYVSDGGAWDEFGFQFMFVRLLEAILTRYKDLTGLALLNALDRNINRIAFENKWDISITLGVITDRIIFRDLDELLAACKALLSVACEHINVVLGQKLSQTLVRDAISSLDAHSMHIIEKYSIDAFLGVPRVITGARERANA